eukprot:SM000241S08511  [mRNA]  locus=s241:361:5714:+ [translate_table: standard]
MHNCQVCPSPLSCRSSPIHCARVLQVIQAAVEEAATTTITKEGSEAPPPSPEDDVRVVNITSDTLTLRGRSSSRLKLEIEYSLNRGTTDNAYIIRTGAATAVVIVPDAAFAAAFAARVAEVVGAGGVTHVVLGHVSPKRAGSLTALAEAVGRPVGGGAIKVYCSNPAAQQLAASLPGGDDGLLGGNLRVNVVKAGDTLDLGDGHDLQFILTPTPRWPDGMCAYDPATQLLYTHKLFSAHICEESDFDAGGWDVYGESWRFFYDCMLAPVARQAEVALERLPVVGQFAAPSYAGKAGLAVVRADLGYLWNAVLGALNLPVEKAAALAGGGSQRDDGALVAAALCPLHGPIVRASLTELVREYKHWTADALRAAQEASVAVVFASAYGNTSALAQAISRGVLKAGVGVETVNCEEAGPEEVAALVQRSAGFVIGSPTLAGHMPTPISVRSQRCSTAAALALLRLSYSYKWPQSLPRAGHLLQNALGVILQDSQARSKPCGVFGSFGWSGEAVDELEQRLKDGGFNFAFPSIRCKFKPTESMLQVCEESGTDLAQAVRKAKVKQRAAEGPKFTAATEVEQAVGRVVGSLCVLSARAGDAESAMLASWVSQASFSPPGITIAVAKERAVEGLVLPGGAFVLNVLGATKAGPVSKQLLKSFTPGERRFGDLATTPADNGCTILNDAIAYLECTVKSRLETGDHWVLYATVNGGNLQDDKELTAVHHRKTGARY